MTGHTPGPWRVNEKMRRLGIPVMAHDKTRPVARVYSHQRYGRGDRFVRLFDAEANARLIAAAPDLVEACTAALRMMDYHGGPTFGEENIVYDLLKTAIAKAEGRK